ncbi:Uncharacterized protein K02A2.6 [Eumeta japonica]|uniref:Uncharacterized protein K02A2.6 n=1 Tax=Eumeta variegata TaxID=151549 RepID=A0A4C1TUU0_EUMVA|nr:Uncharacterized protein K02A2.6 [Eumeta japonica]
MQPCSDSHARATVQVYEDDALVYGRTFEDFSNALRDELNRFREANLMVKPSKCTFGRKLVIALRYEISEEGVKPFIKKTSAVLDLERPSNA